MISWGLSTLVFSQAIIYVKSDATGRNDGSSWQDAYTDLSIAIANTTKGQIWVAKGTYLPSLDSNYRAPDNRRDATFHLHDGLKIYGGLDGTETTLFQRNFLRNPTVLSGDFQQNDVQDDRIRQLWIHPTRQDNAYRVVNAVNAGTILLDGFIIQSGNTKPTIIGDPINDKEAQGGGLYALARGKNAYNHMTIRNCYFFSNASWKGSGGIKQFADEGTSSRLYLNNCMFFNCQAAFSGGVGCGTRRGKVETSVSNCTFIHNYALYCGGSISTTIEPQYKPAINRTIIRNSVFWGNDANGCRPDVDDYNAETSVWFSVMEYPYGGVGNFKMCPFFQNPLGADEIRGTVDDDFSILAFCPNDNRDSCLPPVIFNSFFIRGKPVQLVTDLNRASVVSLQAEENSFGIEVALVGFTLSPEKAIEYQLDGHDRNWRLARLADTIFYNNVAGGEYRFRLRAAGTIAEKNLFIKIAPYFWQTAWFRLLTLAVITIGGILAYFLFQNRRLLTKKLALERAQTLAALMQKTADSEMTALRAQMNPHFIFNSLNSINAYILRNEGKTASSYLTEFAHLMRQILDNSAQDAISLENEIEFLQSYFRAEAMRMENKLTWDIRVSEEVDTFETEIPSMILQPYIENAVWHGIAHKPEGGKITISIERDTSSALLLRVEDNGVGRARARELRMISGRVHESKGLKITAERLVLYDQKHGTHSTVETTDLLDSQGNAIGTSVEIRIA